MSTLLTFVSATKNRQQKNLAYARILAFGLKDMWDHGDISLNPEVTSLRLVRWWQEYVTGPDCMMPNRCPKGAGDHCSMHGYIALAKYGLPGWFVVLNDMRKCRKDYGEKGAC